jgi:hypothetical protein
MSLFKINVTEFSFHVGFNETRTFLERGGELFSFLVCDFLDRAYLCESPEIRLSYIAIGVIASFHLYLQAKKPWNPTLGETYVGQWPNGTTMFAEQVSPHPPVTSVHLKSPLNHWRIDAHMCFGIDLGVMKTDIKQKGWTRLRFDDGSTYEWEFPTIRVTGILKGERILCVKGPFRMKDITDNLEFHIKIAPKMSKVRQIHSVRATTIWGGVRRKGADKDAFLIRVTGNYADTIYLDGEPVWRLETDFVQRPCAKVEEDALLPSDCRFRIDRAMLIQGDVAAAGDAKELMQSLQRRDANLRT